MGALFGVMVLLLKGLDICGGWFMLLVWARGLLVIIVPFPDIPTLARGCRDIGPGLCNQTHIVVFIRLLQSLKATNEN